MKKHILITGNSKGIGKAIDYRFNSSFNVVGISRKGGYDLTKLEDIEKFSNNINEKNIIFDCLILNAGVGYYGSFEDNSLENYEEIINLNLLANIRLLYLLKDNIKKDTKIIFVGSIASKKFMKSGAVYQASKFALRGFAGALKKEGKKIFLINPSIVDTNFHKGKVELDKNFAYTKIEDILEVIQGIIFGKEVRFEIDL